MAGAQAARALRLDLDFGFAPISGPFLWELIRERDVDLAFHKFGSNGGDGLYLWDGRRGLIVLNASQPALRLRFTAAHELGHHEMHRFTLDNLLLSDKDIASSTDVVEREANAFAAELLAPDAALRREFEQRDASSLDPLDVVRLMRTYGLSYDASLWRLQNAGVIDPRDRQRLDDAARGRVHQLQAALGFDEQKLFAIPSQRLPEEFVLRTAQLFNAGAIDEGRLAELLRTNRKEAVRRASEFAPEPEPASAGIDALLDI